MIEMISDLLEKAKEEIVTIIEWIKTFSILGKTINELYNAPAVKTINELKNIIYGVMIIAGLIVLYIRDRIKRRH